MAAQPDVNDALGQWLGNQAARHDGALVHIKRHALQPGFADEVGQGLAAGDALLQQRGGAGLRLGRHGSRARIARQIGFQRPLQRVQHKPGGFTYELTDNFYQAEIEYLSETEANISPEEKEAYVRQTQEAVD